MVTTTDDILNKTAAQYTSYNKQVVHSQKVPIESDERART